MSEKRRIFVYKRMDKYSEYNIYKNLSNSEVIEAVEKGYNNKSPNFGNKVWFSGIMSAIDTEDNQITFLGDSDTPDYVNDNFDLVILPMANIFNPNYLNFIDGLIDFFSKIKIPTYVVSCGIQAKSYEEIDDFVKTIGDKSQRLIETIYNTGGEFALRGKFTKAFFDRLCSNTAVVTGCPSMYRFGADVRIDKPSVEKPRLKTVFNGSLEFVKKYCKECEDFSFIDQESYYPLLFSDKTPSITSKELVKQNGIVALKLAAKNRLQLFANIDDWHGFLINNQFDFSFGSRIHGTIMSVLSGVPALLCEVDARTAEMAEFFQIPSISYNDYAKYSLNELYEMTDYTEFNDNFKQKYDNYVGFLKNHNIISDTAGKDTSKSYNTKTIVYPNTEYLSKKVNRSLYIKGYEILLNLK